MPPKTAPETHSKIKTSNRKFRPSTIGLCTIFVVIAGGIFGPGVLQVYPQTQYIATQHQAKKAEIQSSIASINSTLSQRSSALYDVTQRKTSLQAEIAAREASINEINENITQARLVEGQLQLQIEENEKKRDETYAQMEQLIPKIQQESRLTPIQTILESKNIVETWRKLNGLSNIQIELDNIDKRLEQLNIELSESKKQQEEVRLALENSLFLLRSEQDGLQILLEQTQGEEARYQQLISDLETQRQQQQNAAAQLEAQYQADLARIAAEQAAAAQNSGGSNSGSTSGGSSGSGGVIAPSVPGNCRFEDGSNLGVRLSRPAAGYISDNFGCPSITGRSHDGYDIANGIGTPILAAYGGVVERKGFEPGGFGNYVFLRHSTGSTTFYTLYAHMSAPSPLAVGSVAGQGAQIGSMGSTGWSTGPHLHFMIMSNTYNGNLGCTYGTTKCFNPGLYVNF